MKLFYLIFLILFSSSSALAIEDYYQFNNDSEKKRFEQLTTELRCLVCQNQNIAESNASLAQDLREKIYQKIQQGESDKKIIGYLVERYGNFILYRPALNLATIGLWLGPFFLLLVGLSYLFYTILHKKREH